MNDKKQNEIEDLSFLVANAIINNSTAEETAEYLYKHNYRKQSETIKEIIKKILAFSYYIKFEDTNGKDREELVVYESKIKQLAEQYGKEEK